MIKLFRNIRQNLLAEGKTSRYLKYAIGEIILVVIGILIALQVNNWNNDRALKKNIVDFKVALRADLQQDSVQINQKIEFIKNDVEQDSKLYKRINAPDATLDTLVKIARYSYNIEANPYMSFNENTLESFRSTGHFSELNDSLRKNLLQLQNFKDFYNRNMDGNLQAFLDAITAYRSKYPLNSNATDDASPISNQLWNHADPSLYSLMNATMNTEQHLNLSAIDLLGQIQSQNNKILEIIKKE